MASQNRYYTSGPWGTALFLYSATKVEAEGEAAEIEGKYPLARAAIYRDMIEADEGGEG